MTEKVKNIVDAETISIAEEQTPQVRCEVIVGIDETGSVYYKIAGPDQSMITIEGLLKYARVEMDRLWSRSLNQGK